MKQQIHLIIISIALIGITILFIACGDGDTFTDPRDGQKYKTVKIGDQVWMAENLKYKGGAEVIDELGAGYSWDSALVACPDGWHLPNKIELESIVTDTNFIFIWSSTEKEDFSLSAYTKKYNELKALSKNSLQNVRCIQGSGEKQPRFTEFNGFKAIRIGSKIWMANNLNIETPTSICYLEDNSECSKGRFYSISEAKNICPKGWRMPNKKDASSLINNLSKFCKDTEPKRTMDDCSYVRVFWGPKMGYYDDASQFKNGTGSMIIGYWLLSDGYYIQNHVDFQIYSLTSYMKQFNVRCIADIENKE